MNNKTMVPNETVVFPYITLRDWFAGQAMAAELVSEEGTDLKYAALCARRAYAFADAMIIQRDKEQDDENAVSN